MFSMIYLMDLHLCSGIWNRDATATPRTRHAQLLLPLSRRSGTDHATAWMVSSKEAKEVVGCDPVSLETETQRERETAVD